MTGIIGHEILAKRGVATDNKTAVKTHMGGLYNCVPGLVRVDGVDGPPVLSLQTVPHLRPPPSVARDMDYGTAFICTRSTPVYP